jgi:hypothetical protein
MTYQGKDGKQYVSVTAATGGGPGAGGGGGAGNNESLLVFALP